MMITRQEVNQAIGLYDVDEPIIPKKLGFCSNSIDLMFMKGKFVHIPCCRPIFDQDIEVIELPRIGELRQFVCSQCVDRLLSVKPEIEIDVEKAGKKKKYQPGINGNGGVPNARLPKCTGESEG